MANFFKQLSKCKQDIIEQAGTEYSDETVQLLTNFISCIQSGVLCGRSDSYRYICKHYELNGSELAQLWRIHRGIEKSSNTFRCQIHNLSGIMFKAFGEEVFEIFYSQDAERLHQLRVKVLALSTEDVTFGKLYFYEIEDACKGSGKTLSSEPKLEDCKDELKLLRQLKRDRFRKALAGKDAEKLSYIISVMNQPLIDADTMAVNLEKLKVLSALGVVETSIIKKELF